MNELNKYKTSAVGMVVLAVLDAIVTVLYVFCINMMGSGTNHPVLNVISNILIVFISVLSTSLISMPLIEVKGKNTLCKQLLADDILCTPEFFDALSDDKKKVVLESLEASMHFNADSVKGSMCADVREKLKNQLQQSDYYLSSCEYSVRCYLERDVVRKRIVKKISIRAYKDKTSVKFPLCKTSCAQIEEREPLKILRLEIQGEVCNLKECVEPEKKEEIVDTLAQKKGYTVTSRYYTKELLQLSSATDTVIEIEYETITPRNDTTCICRVSAPCQRFKFRFEVEGENKNEYLVSLSAFGFIDDGHSALNHHDNTPTAVAEINSWMFPRDGVAIAILARNVVPAGVGAETPS